MCVVLCIAFCVNVYSVFMFVVLRLCVTHVSLVGVCRVRMCVHVLVLLRRLFVCARVFVCCACVRLYMRVFVCALCVC